MHEKQVNNGGEAGGAKGMIASSISCISRVFYQHPNDAQAESHHHQKRSANIHHKLPLRDLLDLHFFRMSVRRAIDDVAGVLGTPLLGQLCLAFLLHLHDARPWVGRVDRLFPRLVVVVYEGWVVVFTPLFDLRGNASVKRVIASQPKIYEPCRMRQKYG